MNYLKIGGIVACVLIAGLLIYKVNHAFNEAAKVPGLEKELAIQKEALRIQSERFVAAKTLTQTVSKNYEDLLTKRDNDISRLRQRPAHCVPVQFATPTNGINAADKLNKPYNADGVSSSFLIEFAYDAETDRAKVIGLQNFINGIYNLNKE